MAPYQRAVWHDPLVRLFHTSDTHLGHQQYPRTGPDGLNVRERDVAQAFLSIVDRAVEERPDLFLHAGDLFDGVRPGNRALAVAMEGFLRLSRAGIPTVVIAGNHEHPRMRGTGSPMRLFEHLEHVHMVYKGQAESLALHTSAGPVTVHAVPQCQDQETLEAEVRRLERPARGHSVLMLHGAVRSMEAFRHAEFNEQTLEPSWFDDRFDYVALGHFHGVTEIAPRAWYCGASERVSIAESGEAKGFLDVRLGGEGVDARHVPLPGRPYADLPVLRAEGLDAEAVVAAAVRAIEAVPPQAVCRLRIDGVDPALRGVLDLQAIRQAGPDLLHLELKVAWKERDEHHGSDVEFGTVWDEFASFAARQPLEGLDRQVLLARAREVLEADL